ncbi:MAG: hypothetical protein ACRCX4_08215 [Bacteroidales bacterium]
MKVQISVKTLMKESFSLFKENILILLGLIFGGIVFALLLMIPSTFEIGGVTGSIISQIIISLFQVVYNIMIIKYCLKAIRGLDPGFSEILPNMKQFINSILYSIITMIILAPYFYLMINQTLSISGITEPISSPALIGVIFVYTIIAAFILAFRFWPVMYLIIDKNYGIGEAIKKGWTISQGNKMSLLKIILICFILFILGALALIIGIFVAMAYVMLLFTLFYAKVASQLDENSEEEINTNY